MSTLIEDVSNDTLQFSFEQTVPRSLVHKRSLENVLLTEIRTRADNHFVCAGRVPTAHSFFNDGFRTPRRDILFYTEFGRQASLAISHAFLDVSTDQVFIFEQSEAKLKAAAWDSGVQSEDSIVSKITVVDTEKRRNGTVSRVVAEQTMSVGSDIVFDGIGAWTIQPKALFQRLRRLSARASLSGETAPDATAARVSGPSHRTANNVVISAPAQDEQRAEFTSFLIVDDTHPYFFDHPCDHVPGMLLLEGCAQLALAAVAKTTSIAPEELVVSAYDVNFA